MFIQRDALMTPTKHPIYFELTIETRHEGADHHIGRMIVKADTREEAIQGLQDVLSGKISMRDVPKYGLDLRKIKEAE
jgi:hypothetical protein